MHRGPRIVVAILVGFIATAFASQVGAGGIIIGAAAGWATWLVLPKAAR